MKIAGTTALVTGANRGIGRAFVAELQRRGAAKVYAGARDVDSIDANDVVSAALDITDPESVARAAETANDVDLLINNAGISVGQDLITGDPGELHREIDTVLWGTLAVVRSFAPVLASRGGGAMLTVLSAMSWFSLLGGNSYSVSKAAQWAMTNGVRLELASQGTLVTGLHVGAVDTDMMATYNGPKANPTDVVRAGLDGIEQGRVEVLADATAARVKATLANDPTLFYGDAIVSGNVAATSALSRLGPDTGSHSRI